MAGDRHRVVQVHRGDRVAGVQGLGVRVVGVGDGIVAAEQEQAGLELELDGGRVEVRGMRADAGADTGLWIEPHRIRIDEQIGEQISSYRLFQIGKAALKVGQDGLRCRVCNGV